jgi:hypothetical protein
LTEVEIKTTEFTEYVLAVAVCSLCGCYGCPIIGPIDEKPGLSERVRSGVFKLGWVEDLCDACVYEKERLDGSSEIP